MGMALLRMNVGCFRWAEKLHVAWLGAIHHETLVTLPILERDRGWTSNGSARTI